MNAFGREVDGGQREREWFDGTLHVFCGEWEDSV
jgi:hypothetical protein